MSDPLDELMEDVITDEELEELTQPEISDELLEELTQPEISDELLDELTHDPYTTVIRTETCGKSECSCHDDPENEHGPYEYHVHSEPDGSRRWEYIGPAYEI